MFKIGIPFQSQHRCQMLPKVIKALWEPCPARKRREEKGIVEKAAILLPLSWGAMQPWRLTLLPVAEQFLCLGRDCTELEKVGKAIAGKIPHEDTLVPQNQQGTAKKKSFVDGKAKKVEATGHRMAIKASLPELCVYSRCKPIFNSASKGACGLSFDAVQAHEGSFSHPNFLSAALGIMFAAPGAVLSYFLWLAIIHLKPSSWPFPWHWKLTWLQSSQGSPGRKRARVRIVNCKRLRGLWWAENFEIWGSFCNFLFQKDTFELFQWFVSSSALECSQVPILSEVLGRFN